MASFSSGCVIKNKKKHNGKKAHESPTKPAVLKHRCLRGGRTHTARHHSCKMSSGASSNAKRLTLIHKQLPLALCRCRFRTAVPPNISLPCLANIEKKKKKRAARLPSLLKKKYNGRRGGGQQGSQAKEKAQRKQRRGEEKDKEEQR